MKIKWLFLLFFLFSGHVFAEPCKIEISDLAAALRSANKAEVLTVSNLTDIHSNEPIRRYVQVLSDGAMVIVEQKHCMIYNLTITLLLPEGSSMKNVPLQLANTLEATVLWKKWFMDLDAEEICKCRPAAHPLDFDPRTNPPAKRVAMPAYCDY